MYGMEWYIAAWYLFLPTLNSHISLFSAGPQDGGWGPWSHWSDCPKPCGLSPGVVITRTRRCNSPPPQNGGKACNGNATEEVLSCFEPCPGMLDVFFSFTSVKNEIYATGSCLIIILRQLHVRI